MREQTVCLTVAQALVRYLQQQYSELDGREHRLFRAMFGIFGHGNVAGLGQALYEYESELPYFQPRNEQSMVHTAIGFAKASRRLSTMACTSSIGPGSTNMLTGAASATINRLPVLLLPSDYYATRHQGPVLQQLEHPMAADVSVNDCFRPLSRFFDRISRPEQLMTALPEAMRVLTDPVETGTVTLALPQDVQAHAYNYPLRFFERRVWHIERRQASRERLAEVLALLKRSKRPTIIAGGGVYYSDAAQELLRFAERIGAPIGETYAGKGVITKPSSLLLGGIGLTGTSAAARIISQSDLVLCVGTRLSDFVTGSHSLFQFPDVRFVSINVCSHDAYKLGALPVIADAREALKVLDTLITEAGIKPSQGYLKEIASVREEWQQSLSREVFRQIPGEAMSQGQLLEVINRHAQPGDTIVAAASLPGDLHKLWNACGGRRCHLEMGYSCMGYELPAGLGVRLAQPSGEVYVLIGDGTYLMNPCELVTAVQEKLKVTIIICENHGFQVIRQLQMARVGRSFGNEFRARNEVTNRLEGEYLPIDLCGNAAALGARTWHVNLPEDLDDALAQARKENRPCVIVAEVEKHRYLPGAGVWWDVAPAEVTSDPVTARLRAQYEEERRRLQKFYY